MTPKSNSVLAKRSRIFQSTFLCAFTMLFSFTSMAQAPLASAPQGCYQKINQEFKSFDNISKELNKDSIDRLQKLLAPTLIPGSFFLLPGLATAFLSLYLSAAKDQVEINKIIKTVALLDISYKIINKIPFTSEDYFKLGVFNKFKVNLEKKAKRRIPENHLAKVIADEDVKPFEENLICHLGRGGNVIISPFNSGLRRKIYKAFNLRDDLNEEEPIASPKIEIAQSEEIEKSSSPQEEQTKEESKPVKDEDKDEVEDEVEDEDGSVDDEEGDQEELKAQEKPANEPKEGPNQYSNDHWLSF